MKYALSAGGSGTGDLLIRFDTEDLTTMPPSAIHEKKKNAKEMDNQKRDNAYVLPCRTGERLQEGQPLSTTVDEAGGDSGQRLQVIT